MVNNSTFKAHSNPLFTKLKLVNLDDTYKLCVLTFMHGYFIMITFPLPSKICLSLKYPCINVRTQSLYESSRLRTFSFENNGLECTIINRYDCLFFFLQRTDFLQLRVFIPSPVPVYQFHIQYEALQESSKQVDEYLMVRYS